jgi:hypothetical protein
MSYGYISDPRVNFNPNNPFLEMIDVLDDAGGQEQQLQAGPPAENIVGRFKLPDFWPHAPGIWFARAELWFEVGGVVSERQQFAFTVDALPYEALCLLADLVEVPPADQPYTVLKDRLLMAHQLMPVEKAVKLMAAPDLGDRRPSAASNTVLEAVAPAYQQLLQRFPDVLSPTKDLPPVKHSVEHFIETEGRPVAAKYRRLDLVKLKAAQAEFADLERQGIIRRSNSMWSEN